MPQGTSKALRELAQLRGVQLQYRGVDGRRVAAEDEVLRAVLTALGEPLGNAGDVVEALEEAKSRRFLRQLEPVIAHRQGRRSMSTLSLPAGTDCTKVRVTLRFEDGSESQGSLADPAMRLSIDPAPDNGTCRFRFCAVTADTPPGYHSLVVETPAIVLQALVIAAPAVAPRPERSWGDFIPLYALRRATDDWGIGSFHDLAELGDWTRAQGGRFVATLPLLAHFVDASGKYPGPYLPASKLAWNEAYVDVESLVELASQDRWAESARAAIASRPGLGQPGTSQNPERADVAAVLRKKRPILELLARSLFAGSSTRRREFEEFVAARPEIREYARFRAASETLGADWHDWPKTSEADISRLAVDEEAVRYHLYSQWVADRQLADCAERGLYLDMPIGVHPSGFDTWWQPSLFVTGVSGGAPPDPFFSEGQSWGFPPLHPDCIREDGYRYVIACLRHVMAHACVMRVDHVMGLHRLYCVPDGFDARHGAYVRYHADEMRALLVLEASRSNTVVAGEDLGTVPPVVRSDMARDGMLSSFVLQFTSTEFDPFPVPPELSIATLGTHDLPTFRAFWSGYDIENHHRQVRVDSQGKAEEEIARAQWRDSTMQHLNLAAGSGADPAETAPAALRGFLEHLGRSPAQIVLVDLEDLWLEPDQQNRPGTGAEERNFTRRASLTMEEIEVDPGVIDVLGALNVARTGAEETPGEMRSG
ncbi:MAG: 4-alpha-glucanotransferase [Acidimicrobiales bacterium]